MLMLYYIMLYLITLGDAEEAGAGRGGGGAGGDEPEPFI